MNIPDAAINAVAEHMATMDDTDEVSLYRADARRALEAALPHLGEQQYGVQVGLDGDTGVIATPHREFADYITSSVHAAGRSATVVQRTVHCSEWTEVKP